MQYLLPSSDAPAPTLTAVIVPISAADALVGEHRRRLDTAAGWGVPAHVTVLFPFVDPADVDASLIADLTAAVTTVSAFECHFEGTQWFDEDVLWLEPDPGEPFRALTAAVWAAFPEHPPYSGDHDEVIPHLTLAERRRGDLSTLRAAERAVRPGLPLTATIDRVLLIEGTRAPASWRTVADLPLPQCLASTD